VRDFILFVDDEASIRRYCQQELEAAGFRVALASDGQEALAILDMLGDSAVNLVVLDRHMPVCNGQNAARNIKERHPLLPVILFTADRRYERLRDRFVDASVIKSDNLAPLLAAISDLLLTNGSSQPCLGDDSKRTLARSALGKN
jgi:CheY-like chemotaxis protein